MNAEKTGWFTHLKMHIRQSLVYYVIIVVLCGVIWYIHYEKDQQIMKLKASQEVALDSMHQEMVTLVQIRGMEYLGLMVKTFSWAIRNELIKENYDQLNLYIVQLIKERGVSEIELINDEGLIVASSNKKFEQLPFENFHDIKYLQAADVEAKHDEQGNFTLTSPVMSFNKRIGTVFIKYHDQEITKEQTIVSTTPII